MNKVEVSGPIMTEISLKYVGENGTAKAFFRIEATDEDGKKDKVPVTVWAEMAEHVANTFKKGQEVRATGKMFVRSWKDGNDQWRDEVGLNAFEVKPANAAPAKSNNMGAPVKKPRF